MPWPKKLNRKNKYLIQTIHNTASWRDVQHSSRDGQFFSTLDAKSGYWTKQLNEQRQLRTTFNTPFKKYCFRHQHAQGRLLLTSLLLYFYSEHLESSVTIYSVLQVVLFVELLTQINEISGILQIVRKLPSPGELFYTRPINTRLSMSMKLTTLTVKQKADLNDKRSELLKPLKHDKNVYLHNLPS